jgi:hypothetical protein
LKRFSLILAVASLGAMCVAGVASAEHARPLSATPLTFQLVPSFKPAAPCAGTVTAHGAPLAVASCNPPVQTSSYLTAQDPSRPAPFTGPADGTGRVILSVKCVTASTTTVVAAPLPCNTTPANQDVLIDSSSTGVRCQVAIGGGVCAAPNALYNGKVLGVSQIQITDHDNTAGVAGSPCPSGVGVNPNCAGTVTSLPFSVGAQCSSGACNYITSANLTVPGVTKEVKRGVVELGQLQIQDAGADGQLAGANCPPTCAQNDATFAVASVQGLFAP